MTLEKAIEILDVNVICYPKSYEFKEAVGVVEFALEYQQAVINNLKKDCSVVVLPCNVGDTVYKVIERCNLSSHICVFNGGYGSPRCCVKPCGAYIEEINFSINMIDLVGKSIFLNRKEAERVLKGK